MLSGDRGRGQPPPPAPASEDLVGGHAAINTYYLPIYTYIYIYMRTYVYIYIYIYIRHAARPHAQ